MNQTLSSHRVFCQAILLTLLSVLFTSASHANNDDPISMASIALSKQVGGLAIYGVSGELKNTIEGRLATVGVSGKINDQWRWQTEYFGLFTERGATDIHDNRARTALTYTHKLNDWQFAARPLLEYRNSEVLNGFRFRPRLALSRKLSWRQQKITPAIKLEPFYELRSELVTTTFLTLGAEWAIDSNLALNGSYIRAIAHQRDTDIEGPAISLIVRL